MTGWRDGERTKCPRTRAATYEYCSAEEAVFPPSRFVGWFVNTIQKHFEFINEKENQQIHKFKKPEPAVV